ncbi:hypothetical protein GGF46_001974 [Coemansia sp. RSA 552]|nr:hypothetical protein GGF46_001974 [Coemansia sp. RSA 552]
MSTRTAWDAEQARVLGYAREAVGGGVVSAAAVDMAGGGRLLVAMDMRLELFDVDTTQLELVPVCSAPVFGQVVDIAHVDGGVFAVLGADGHVAYVAAESSGGRERLRVRRRSSVTGGNPRSFHRLSSKGHVLAAAAWTGGVDLIVDGTRIHVPVDGAVGDVAVLAGNTHVLVVVLVETQGEAALWLLEATNGHACAVARLPLAPGICPMRVVAVDAPERFVLLGSRNVYIASAQQIQSGDVLLPSVPLPNSDAPPRACCTGFSGVYVAVDGALLVVEPQGPYVRGVGKCLRPGAVMAHVAPGLLFIAGDGAPATLMRVGETAIAALPTRAPAQAAIVDSGRVLATAGRGHCAAVLDQRLGHDVHVHGAVVSEQRPDSLSATQAWALPAARVLLQNGSTSTAFVATPGAWSICPRLTAAIGTRRIVDMAPALGSTVVCVLQDAVGLFELSDTAPDPDSIRLLSNAPPAEHFTHGACTGGWAVVASQPVPSARRTRLSALPLATGTPAEAFIDSAVSCLRSFAIGKHRILIAAGTHEPSLRLFCLCTDSETPSLEALSLETPLPSGADAVSDICMLGSEHILVGLRDGRLLHTTISPNQLEATPMPVQTVIPPGTTPVAFASLDSGGPCIVACSGALYVARLQRSGHLEITPCVGGPGYDMLLPIHHTVPLASESGSFVSGSASLLALAGEGAYVVSIDLEPRCVVRELPMPIEPQLLAHDKDTGLILAVGKPETGGDYTLQALDPCSGSICASTPLRSRDDLPCALATWCLRGPKTYRFVCVGTAQHTGRAATAGRLAFYSLKPSRRQSRTPGTPAYELKYVWESARTAPVTALASLGESYLVMAVGASCVVLRLDVERRRLIECSELKLRFPATSLAVRAFDIVAGSKREALHVLRFTPSPSGDRLELIHATRFGAVTSDACFLAPDLVAGVAHTGLVYVVGIPAASTEFALDSVLAFHLGVACTCVRAVRLSRRLTVPTCVLPWASGSDRVECLVIVSISGAIWTLVRISEDAFCLLDELARAMASMPDLHPARPILLDPQGQATRACGSSTFSPMAVADGMLVSIFADVLTDDERREVAAASPELCRLAALQGADGSPGSASTLLCNLVDTLNCASTC